MVSDDRVSFRSPFPSPKAFQPAISWSENPHHRQHFTGDFSGEFFPPATFSDINHIIKSAKRRSATFLIAPEPKTHPRATLLWRPESQAPGVRAHGPLSRCQASFSKLVWHCLALLSLRQSSPNPASPFFGISASASLLSTSSSPQRQLPSLAETCSSSTAMIRPPFRALFDPNVIQSQRPWNSGLWAKIMRIILLHLRMLYLMLTKCNGRRSMHNYAAYYGNLLIPKFSIIFVPTKPALNFGLKDMDLSTYIGRIASLKEEFLTLMPFTNGVEAQQIQSDKFFIVLTFMASTLSTDGPSDSSVLASHTNSRGGRSGNRGREQRPQCTYSTSASVVSVAQTGNVSVCLTQSPSLGPWILDSGASDHISGLEYGEGNWHRVTSSPPRLRNASSWDTLDFRKAIIVIPPTLIVIFSPLMSHSLRTLHSSYPLNLFPFLKYCHFPIYPPLQMRSLVLFRFIIVDIVLLLLLSLQLKYLMTHLPSHRFLLPQPCHLLIICLLLFGKSTSEALSHPGWRQAMVDEMAALHSNGTRDLVSLPPGKSTVGCRWVYTVKVGPNGQVDPLKACLVAKDYTQIYGCDYGDTFSPVAKIASVRLFLFMAAMCHWPFYQLDIKNVFLHGELLKEVYMEQPPGFVAQGKSGLVCKLRRSLYGLKQSPRAWFGRFSSVVQEFGMLWSSDQEGIQRLKQYLFNHFQTKDLGKLKYFLGLEIAQSSSGVVMSQKKYVLDILEETGMLECKPADTSMDPNVKLVPGQGEPLRDPGRYR
ncbi:Retrovirus-related Pol polyprotein from transposon RE1 [Vitis vinifera]|uniref:Retrovirus-related Pol polyprotein from transposon RE1 n=1 Tax=Vitis vinifera TaxID=29760 RepID=A0A438FZ18_VITVI|nr:Retrovirus-related Pol polyprotein from transposon RE1 [Vitis vinifera]